MQVISLCYKGKLFVHVKLIASSAALQFNDKSGMLVKFKTGSPYVEWLLVCSSSSSSSSSKQK
jgi:hypothetical protein